LTLIKYQGQNMGNTEFINPWNVTTNLIFSALVDVG